MSFLEKLWGGQKAKATDEAAEALLFAVSEAARDPELYGPGRASDAFQSRLEMLMAHAALAMIRLKQSPESERLSQIFADRFFKHIEYGLREFGVGDLTVPKKMKKLAGAFYGRVNAYAEALALEAPLEALPAALARNALGPDEAGFAPALAAILRARHAALAAGTVEDMVAGRGLKNLG